MGCSCLMVEGERGPGGGLQAAVAVAAIAVAKPSTLTDTQCVSQNPHDVPP